MLLVFDPVKIYLQESSTSVSITTVSYASSTSNVKCHLVDCLDELLQYLVAVLFLLL